MTQSRWVCLMKVKVMSNRYWVRWYHCYETMGAFELFTPWWCSGSTSDEPVREILVAAIKADSVDEIREILCNCYDKRPESIEISFIEECTDGSWDPVKNVSGRFPFAEWMHKYWEREKYEQKP